MLANYFYMSILSFILVYSPFVSYVLLADVADVSMIGLANFDDGLGRVTIGIIDALAETDLKINFRPTRNSVPNLSNLKTKTKNILIDSDRTDGRVSILTDAIWDQYNEQWNQVPQGSLIKLAYSMLESDRIPTCWVSVLNEKADAVVVPDRSLVDVYKNSGVKIPIFVLPLVSYLEDFLNRDVISPSFDKFTFGNMSAGWLHKNHILLIEAFAKAFGDNPNVQLLIHARGCQDDICKSISNKLQNMNLTNINYDVNVLDWDKYVDFMFGLNCYVSLSKGEGFAFAPREALAAGKPVILSNNTAHTTICDTDLVKCVASEIKEPAYYPVYQEECGNFFNCEVDEVAQAMQDLYNNYSYFLDKSLKGREWVKLYLLENLRARYINLVQPKYIVLGSHDILTDKLIMTSSLNLYKKYIELGAIPLDINIQATEY